jgi:chorismate synthase
VALGEIAARFLEQAYGIRLVSHTVSIGTAGVPVGAALPTPDDVERLDADPVRAFDPEGSAAMVAEVDAAKKDGDTLGGVVEVLAYGLPPGLGSHVHWDRKLDGQLAQALMSIQAIKGVEVGDGFETARRRGSEAHDEMELVNGVITRRTGRAGGTEGGMSTGQVLRVRAAMKPISTVPRALATVDVATGEAATAIHQRSDVCAVPAAGVVAEAMVALVLAQSCLEKFGGDSVTETARNHSAYLGGIHDGLRTWCATPETAPPPSSSVHRVRARRPSEHCSPSVSAFPSTTSTRPSRRPRVARSPTSSSTTARRPSATSSGRRSRARSPMSGASWRSAGER